MHWLDCAIVAAYLIYIVYDGLRLTKKSNEVEGYFLASRSLPWWAVGLSVMATQMSAITICCTTGQGYISGLRFVQMYLGRRFDVRVRSLASFLFLAGRALSLGVTLSAPAVVMSAVLGWTLPVTVLAICVPMILYTTIGGVQAVAWTDVKQMVVVVASMSLAVGVLIYGILQH